MKIFSLALPLCVLCLGLNHASYAQETNPEVQAIASSMKQVIHLPSKIDDHLLLKNVESSGTSIIFTIEGSNTFFKNNTVSSDQEKRLRKYFLARTCGNKFSSLMFNKGISLQENYVTPTTSTPLLSFSASQEKCRSYTGPKGLPPTMSH